jgi:hypothetical protein
MRRKRLNPLLLAVTVSVCLLPRLKAQQESIPAQANPPSTPAQDAAAKAAERKKRFEEQRRRLEEDSTSNSEGHSASASQTLFISPAIVNMVLGDTQPLLRVRNRRQDDDAQCAMVHQQFFCSRAFRLWRSDDNQ